MSTILLKSEQILTVRDLRKIVNSFPDVDEDGTPTEVWITNSPSLSTLYSQMISFKSVGLPPTTDRGEDVTIRAPLDNFRDLYWKTRLRLTIAREDMQKKKSNLKLAVTLCTELLEWIENTAKINYPEQDWRR